MNREIALSAALLVATAAFVVRAEEKKMMSQQAQDMHGMTPDMMNKMKEAGAPGPEHARFKDIAGAWNTLSKGWMKPDDQPLESQGTATFTWILGDRFLEQRFNGEMAGEKFQGVGYLGYDKLKKRYESTWMDTMSTGMFMAPGKWDDATKTLTSEGTFSCPMTGNTKEWFRSEWKIPGGNTQTFIMYGKDKAGKTFKTMEMTYTRA